MSNVMMNDPHGIAMAAKEKINIESFRALQDLVASPMCIPYTVRCDSYAHRDLVRDGLATCRKSSDALGEFDLIEITEAGHVLLSQIKTEDVVK